MTQTLKTPPGMCPNCGNTADAGQGYHGGNPFHGPGTGDFTICGHCATLLRFQNAGRLKMLEEEDLEGAPVEFVESLADLQKAAKMHLALQGKGDQTKPKQPN